MQPLDIKCPYCNARAGRSCRSFVLYGRSRLCAPHKARLAAAVSGWERIEFKPCDCCPRRAVWAHPKGGFRCSHCIRP